MAGGGKQREGGTQSLKTAVVVLAGLGLAWVTMETAFKPFLDRVCSAITGSDPTRDPDEEEAGDSGGIATPGDDEVNKGASNRTWTIRARSMKVITKYEKEIEELTMQCKLKSDECHEASMSVVSANEQLERSTLELDNKYFRIDNLEQALEKQMERFKDVSGRQLNKSTSSVDKIRMIVQTPFLI